MKRKTKYQLAALLIFAALVSAGLSQTPTGSPKGKRGEPEQAQPESKASSSATNPLGGQNWRLKELNGEPIEQRDGADAKPPDLKFDAEKKTASGSTGINRLAGG